MGGKLRLVLVGVVALFGLGAVGGSPSTATPVGDLCVVSGGASRAAHRPGRIIYNASGVIDCPGQSGTWDLNAPAVAPVADVVKKTACVGFRGDATLVVTWADGGVSDAQVIVEHAGQSVTTIAGAFSATSGRYPGTPVTWTLANPTGCTYGERAPLAGAVAAG